MVAGDFSSPVFSFTSLDYASVQADLTRFAQTVFPDDQWTDFNPSNPATHFLELLAYATDLLAYNMNAVINETIPVNCVRTSNFINLAKSFDYVMKGAAPSETTLNFTLNPSGTYPFTISHHLQCSTSDGTIFQPDADTTVGSYTSSGITVAATQGKEIYQEAVGFSNGQPGQAYSLQQYPVIDGSVSIVVASTAYSQVDNAVAASPTDKAYLLSKDENGIVTITFGDGINGVIPPSGSAIQATYYVGGGTNTNYPIGTITSISGMADGSAIPSALLSVTNPTAATGGGPAQTLANAQQNLPLEVAANDRAVTFQDYAATVTALVPSVLIANAVAGIPIGGTTPALILPVLKDGSPVDPTTVNLVVQALTNGTTSDPGGKKMAGKRIQVRNPIFVDLSISADVYVKPTGIAATVTNRVSNAFLTEYGINSVSFAATFALQDAYDSVAPAVVDGVARVFIKQFSVIPYSSPYLTNPIIGTGSAQNIITNSTTQRREWNIQVINSTVGFACNQFRVTQRQIGTISSLTNNTMVDLAAGYTPNSLVGTWVLHPNQQTQNTTFTILGNSSQEITVNPGLFAVAGPGDPYAIECTELLLGKILTGSITADTAAGSAVLNMTSATDWRVGDRMYIEDTATGNSGSYTILSVVGLVVTLTVPLAFTAPAATTVVNYLWTSADGSLQFSVVNDTSASGHVFVAGDEFFVDTFAQAADIVLRPENFPRLNPSAGQGSLILNPIGGIS